MKSMEGSKTNKYRVHSLSELPVQSTPLYFLPPHYMNSNNRPKCKFSVVHSNLGIKKPSLKLIYFTSFDDLCNLYEGKGHIIIQNHIIHHQMVYLIYIYIYI